LLINSKLCNIFATVKQLLLILILLGFCANQLRIVKPVTNFIKQISKTNADMDDETTDDEDKSEKEESEKEIEYYITNNYPDHITSLILTQEKCNNRFLHLLYSNPFSQKDIKPPRCA
jgi:hypothetical protein